MNHKNNNSLQILVLICLLIGESFASIKVCNSYWDFYNPFSKNCWKYDYDNLDVAGIAESWNFEAEKYPLTLEDGYIITVYHIFKKVTKNNPIILGHGAEFNSLSWVTSGNNSLAYVLGNLGYDLWVVGWRGTVGSFGHVNFTKPNLAYWQGFTFHEMGIYDMKATIDLVYNKTRERAIYIGHSMGTTISYIYSSSYPDQCKERLLGIVSLAPVAYVEPIGITGLISREPQWSSIKLFADTFMGGLFIPRTLRPLFILGSKTPLGNILITFVLGLLVGPHIGTIDPKITPIFYNKLPGAVGAHLWTHYVQIVDSKKFREFDYGKKKNQMVYQSEEPPDYPLEKISVPVTMFIGKGDWIARNSQAKKIHMQIPKSSQCGYILIKNAHYNHADFYVAKDNQKLLYEPLLEKIGQLEKGQCIE